MTRDDILSANKLIRPLLCGNLSLVRAIYAPCDPHYGTAAERLEAALKAFDALVAYAAEQQAKEASDLTGHIDDDEDDDDLNMEPGTTVAPPNEEDE